MNNGNDLTIVIGGLVTIIGGFYAIAKVMLSQASKDREADRLERIHLARAIDKMGTNSGKVAQATLIGNKQAEERNGHLAELVLQGTTIAKENLEANKSIRQRLEKTAVIAAEDRDVLTNQNKHIAHEVDKRINNRGDK